MTDFIPQSTNRLNDNTNPYLSNVVYESSTTIALSLTSGYFQGSSTITLPLDTNYAGLVVEAWIKIQLSGGGNPVSYRPLTESTYSSAVVLVSSGSINISSSAKAGTYDISFSYLTSSTLLVNPTVYYRIKSDRIKPGNLF